MTTNDVKPRKVILFNMISLDGFFAGPDGNIDWHNVDGEFNDFAIAQLDTVGALLFGRVTYQLMASYWTTQAALTDDPVVAGKMNSLPKVVFSRTLGQVDWRNTTLVNGEAAQAVSQLKQQAGQDLYIFGSANLAAALSPVGLIDEYRVIISPVVLGQGMPLFQGFHQQQALRLINAHTFRSGNVLLTYQPIRAA